MEKAEFENTSPGVCGVVTVDPGGKPRAVPVKPNESIWLTEEEQVLTANSHRKAEDNPFVNGTLTLRTKPKDLANRRPIGYTEQGQPEVSGDERKRIEEKKRKQEETAKKMAEREAEREAEARKQAENPDRPVAQRAANEETGVQVEPTGDGPKGERAADEEVGTPSAEPKQAKPKPAKAKAS